MPNNNLELIERINEQLHQAGALGSVYASVAWSYAGSYLNALLGSYTETDPDRIKRLEARVGELAQIAGWASSLAIKEYRPTVDQLIERLGRVRGRDEATEAQLLEVKAQVTGLDLETLRAAMELSARGEAERAELQRRVFAQHEKTIRFALSAALTSPMDSGFELSDQDAVRIAERLHEKAAAARDRELMQVVRARKMSQITESAAAAKLLEPVVARAEALYLRLSAEIERQQERSPLEQEAAELTGTDEHEAVRRYVPRKVV